MKWTSLININYWNYASWTGCAYGFESSLQMPFLGINFKNREAGFKIFSEWQNIIGKVDRDELIRISILEHEDPEKDPSYIVHIGTNPRPYFKTSDDHQKHIMLTSRIHEMVPSKPSQHLALFKLLFVKHGKFLFLPAYQTSSGIEANWDLAIEKKSIHFRVIEKVTDKNDEDFIIHAKASEIDVSGQRDGDTEKLDPDYISQVFAIFGQEILNNTIEEELSTELVERYVKLKKTSTGLINTEELDPILFSVAEIVAKRVWERKILSTPLSKIQKEYIEILRYYFSDSFKQMNEAKIDAYSMACHLAKDARNVQLITEKSKEMADKFKSFWNYYAPQIILHLQNMRTRKIAYSGSSFPKEETDLTTPLALFADTVVLPDPIYTGFIMAQHAAPEEAARIFIENGLVAMKYADMALATTKAPLIVFAPSPYLFPNKVRDILNELANLDTVKHANHIFQFPFDDIDSVKNYFNQAQTVDMLIRSIEIPERFLFNSDVPRKPSTQAESTLSFQQEKFPKYYKDDKKLWLLFNALFGRFLQTQVYYANLDIYGAIPLIDAPTSWQYFLWSLEYKTQRETSIKDDTVIVNSLISTDFDIPELKNVPLNKLCQIRESNVLKDLRNIITNAIDIASIEKLDKKLAAKSAKNVVKESIEKHRRDLQKIRKELISIGIHAAGQASTIGLSIGSASTGSVELATYAAISSVLGFKSLPEIVKKGKGYLEKRTEAANSAVGILLSKN